MPLRPQRCWFAVTFGVAVFFATSMGVSAQTLVTLETIAGEKISGDIITLGPELEIIIDTERRKLEWADIRKLTLASSLTSAADGDRGPFHIRLRDGNQLIGAYDRAVGVGPRIISADTAYLVLPRELWQFVRRDLSETAALRVSAALSESEEQDRVIIQKEDDALVLRGEILDVDQDVVEFVWNRRPLTIPWSRIAGLSWAGESSPRGDTTITGPEGIRFVGRLVGAEPGYLLIRTRALGEVSVPREMIDEVQVGLGRMVYLSEMTPLLVEQQNLITSRRPLAVDRSLYDAPIALAGERFERGVCMRSRSTAIYRLDGQFAQFVSTVGIADDVRPLGNASLRVIGDDKTLWSNESIRGDQSPQQLAIDVEGVRVLTLEVDFGADLDLSDHVCWGAARLIRP